ncbi:hypothetical protein [Dyadobacter bucti]|jgi:uncharacterized protein YodC (DUF2158 family)|uniref:hypothetical protein n=1 Tax=Dyadobacter bucti TaxID=2572203 RepID=UPI003F7291CF
MMDDTKFKEGDWVKEKNGTRGMTVVGYAKDEAEGQGEVRCRYKTESGEETEAGFPEDDLVSI